MVLSKPVVAVAFAAPMVAAAFLAAAAIVGASSTALAQKSFDGAWSVLIVTERGECDRAYRYGVRIAGGRILYDGEAGVSFTGSVGRDGRLTAFVSRGSQSASGSGRLSGNQGEGTWSGKSATGQCSGRWEAERRSS
jgi:hypothetical protein